MTDRKVSFSDIYTRKISGEQFRYEAVFTPGREVTWSARVYRDGALKGSPSGSMVNNSMSEAALKQYVIAYVESIIEKGLDIAE